MNPGAADVCAALQAGSAMARSAAGFDSCSAYLGTGVVGEGGCRDGACRRWSGAEGFFSDDRGFSLESQAPSSVLLRGLLAENSVKDVCARRPCALSGRPPGTKMKSCQGRSTLA